MARCKECIYEPKCFYRVMYGKGVDETGKPTLSKLQMCGHFKNKSDFQEVKHGMWEDEPYMWICNICGKWLDIRQGSADMNYCSHCGARMDGEK